MRKEPMLLPDADKRGMRAAQYVRMSTDHQQYSTLNKPTQSPLTRRNAD
jgi:hypothetical protein